MQQISSELEESAQVSGAGWWHVFRRVLLPLLVAGPARRLDLHPRRLASASCRARSCCTARATRSSRSSSGSSSRTASSPILAALGVLMVLILVVLVAIAYKLGAKVGLQSGLTRPTPRTKEKGPDTHADDRQPRQVASPVSKRAAEESGCARAPTVFAVNDVSFSVQEGEMFTLLGPSGCGKTTTLRSIAGLERPDSGRDRGRRPARCSPRAARPARLNLPANQRGLGMVFQSYAIWPHMTRLRQRRLPAAGAQARSERPGKAEIDERGAPGCWRSWSSSSCADRQATKLSGGQQQRLALARALVIEPPLLLLDEPLSNLDAKLRESLRYELKRLQRELGITSIYVTHDQIEALALSSHIAVMEEGERRAARQAARDLRDARTTSSSPSSSAPRTSSPARPSASERRHYVGRTD